MLEWGFRRFRRFRRFRGKRCPFSNLNSHLELQGAVELKTTGELYIMVRMNHPYTHGQRVAGGSRIARNVRGMRVRGLCMLQIPPPSQLEGRNVGGLKRRMRRVGRLSPKQYRNLTRRRVFASSCDGISLCRNHVEHVEHVELFACSYMICMVNHSTLQLQLETPTL